MTKSQTTPDWICEECGKRLPFHCGKYLMCTCQKEKAEAVKKMIEEKANAFNRAALKKDDNDKRQLLFRAEMAIKSKTLYDILNDIERIEND